MKLFLSLIAALLLFYGPGTSADDFAPLAGTTTAVTMAEEPFQWPVSKVIAGKKVQIISKFGVRKIPPILGIDKVPLPGTPGEGPHDGIDFAVPPMSAVRAARAGKVLFAGFSTAYVSRKDKKDKNHLVIVQHSDGKSSRYVHMDRLLVRPGQTVVAGDMLGKSSASDEWTTPVLHFEIRESNGKAVDPMPYLIEAPMAAVP